MVSLMSVMLPTSCIVQPIGTHGGEVMYFGCVSFRGELGFMNFDDICLSVVKSSLSSSSLFLIPFMLTCSMMSIAFDTFNIHTLTHKLHQTNILHTIIKYIANYIKCHKAYTTFRNKTSTQRQFIMVFHKAACYHPHSSTYTHLTLQHHRHQ